LNDKSFQQLFINFYKLIQIIKKLLDL
jgi:hypothetical protein